MDHAASRSTPSASRVLRVGALGTARTNPLRWGGPRIRRAPAGAVTANRSATAGSGGLEGLAVLGDELARALQNGTRLTENECDGAEVGGAEQIRDEVLDDRDQLGPDGAVGLQFEQIEQHREDDAAQVLREIGRASCRE